LLERFAVRVELEKLIFFFFFFNKLLKGRQLVTNSQSVKGEITTHVVISAILNKCKNVIL
jgi:hypothetical protein